MNADFDVCVIGSGAGGGPVAYTLAEAGYSVVVLEKGPWFTEKDFFKDEIGECRRHLFTPKLSDEPQVVELRDGDGWSAWPTPETGWDFWNGNMVGGATNIMSGFFHRLKPDDFRLRSAFGPVEGAEVVDWPISYDDLEPYYDRVEKIVGVSGRYVAHPWADRRSSPDYPYPPTVEHPIAGWIDQVGQRMGLHPFPLSRAILPAPVGERNGCSYTGYCGNYGCATGAKGSSRAALLSRAVATGRCQVRPHAMAQHIESDSSGRACAVEYRDPAGKVSRVTARIYVVACQSIETARLLLLSTGSRHPGGLANGSGLVGRNLLFSTAASGDGDLLYAKFPPEKVAELRAPLPFINRSFHDWYFLGGDDGTPRRKGGTLDFIFVHPNPIGAASWQALGSEEKLVWGRPLKDKLYQYFQGGRHVMFEVFADWMPVPDCRVELDPKVKDRWGQPVARVRVGKHPRNRETGDLLAAKGREVLERLGCENVQTSSRGAPSTNLLAGTCRFGIDPSKSVLDRDCRAHEVENLFVTDGSFMPTGGSVPYTFTIYANAFRVADTIVKDLGGAKKL